MQVPRLRFAPVGVTRPCGLSFRFYLQEAGPGARDDKARAGSSTAPAERRLWSGDESDCSRGMKGVAQVMNLELEAMALEMPEVDGHPNRLPFHGVLALVGIASRRAPSGARRHRVMLTRRATEAALPSLLGMALDYAPALDAHDARRKIGVITQAEIVPLKAASADPAAQIAVSGYLYAHDFPDVVHTLRAGNGTLGMSYEITDAMVVSPASPIWTVTSFTFTGAAVLRRERAAYPETWIAVG